MQSLPDALVLFGNLDSPFVARCFIAARLKGLTLRLEQPPGGRHSDEYQALSPTGKVPTLMHGKFALPESELICEYFEERWPECPLLPGDAQCRAQIRLVSKLSDLYVLPPVIGVFIATGTADPALLKSIAKGLGWLESRMKGGSYAAADVATFAECSLLPTMFYLNVIEQRLPSIVLLGRHERLSRWWAHMNRNDFWRARIAELEIALAERRAR